MKRNKPHKNGKTLRPFSPMFSTTKDSSPPTTTSKKVLEPARHHFELAGGQHAQDDEQDHGEPGVNHVGVDDLGVENIVELVEPNSSSQPLRRAEPDAATHQPCSYASFPVSVWCVLELAWRAGTPDEEVNHHRSNAGQKRQRQSPEPYDAGERAPKPVRRPAAGRTGPARP